MFVTDATHVLSNDLSFRELSWKFSPREPYNISGSDASSLTAGFWQPIMDHETILQPAN